MKTISVKQIIKDQRYRLQLLCYALFVLVALAVVVLEIVLGNGATNTLISLVVVGLPVTAFFGYYIGLRNILRVSAKMRKLNENRFAVLARTVIDKTMVHADSTNRYCQLVFGAEESVWVSCTMNKAVKVGDECYLILLEGDEDPCALYPRRGHRLAEELAGQVRHTEERIG